MIKKKYSKVKLTGYVKAVGLNAVQDIYVLNGILTPSQEVNKNDVFEVVNLKDCLVSPGFIDPQINGYGECNFWDLSEESFKRIDKLREELALCGVVAFCPTIITAPREKIVRSINFISNYIEHSDPDLGARILGIHLEGIFITKYGVHESKYAQKELTINNIEPLLNKNVILFTLAPELDKSGEAISFLQKNNILVSIGHSNASYKEGENAIKKFNLRTVTHMFNALRGIEGFSHRGNGKVNLEVLNSKLENSKYIDPDHDGIMLAALKNKEVLCMVIADGIHVNKEAVWLLRKYKARDLFALASDLVASDFFNLAKSRGTLGGGQSTLDKQVFNLTSWKVSEIEDSLISASLPIANQLKTTRDSGLGKLAFGKEANIVLWDTRRNAVKGTIIGENVFLNF